MRAELEQIFERYPNIYWLPIKKAHKYSLYLYELNSEWLDIRLNCYDRLIIMREGFSKDLSFDLSFDRKSTGCFVFSNKKIYADRHQLIDKNI